VVSRTTVREWDVIDGGLLGAVIVCPSCDGRSITGAVVDACPECDSDGTLHRPYRLPNGEPLDLWRDAEILIQIEPRSELPSSDEPQVTP
jgi:hypothetical protein